MCLIIQTQNTKPLSKELLEHMQDKNDDGWGMMWVRNNHIRTYKSHDRQGCWEKYEELKEFDPIIHLRWRTHGDISHDNTHPFYCGYGIYLMHNGVVNVNEKDNTKSDTWHMVEYFLKPLFAKTPNPHILIRSKEFIKEFEKRIGMGNRVIIGDRGGYVIYNKHLWHSVTNENTKITGTLVSNTYAWDAWLYGKPKPVYQENYYSYNDWVEKYPGVSKKERKKHKKLGKSRIIIEDGKVRHFNNYNQEMSHLYGNCYMDSFGSYWKMTAEGFQYDKEENDKKLLRTQTGLVLLPSPSPSPTTVIQHPTSANQDFSYIGNLVKKYKGSSKGEVAALVKYAPVDAVNLLHNLCMSAANG